jgi:hypothetical protein
VSGFFFLTPATQAPRSGLPSAHAAAGAGKNGQALSLDSFRRFVHTATSPSYPAYPNLREQTLTETQHLTPEQLLADPSASTWLKTALAAALERDPVDAANDAEVLSAVLGHRADAAVGAVAAGK